MNSYIQNKLYNSPPAEWIKDMVNFHNENMHYRAGDLLKLLGEPTRGVTLPTTPINKENLKDFLPANIY